MVKINTALLLPKKYFDGEMIPEGLIWHGMSAIHADTLGLDNRDPFDVGVNIAILKSMNLSAHGIIDRKGNFYQLVPFSRRARHAGISLLNGRDKCNNWTIGIEFLTLFKTTQEHGPAYTPEQIKTGLELQAFLTGEFGFKQANIEGHDKIRANAINAGMRGSDGGEPKPKPDPGPEFPWPLFRGKPQGLDELQKQALAGRSDKWAQRLARADGS